MGVFKKGRGDFPTPLGLGIIENFRGVIVFKVDHKNGQALAMNGKVIAGSGKCQNKRREK